VAQSKLDEATLGKLKQHGIGSAADFTPAKMVELVKAGGHNAGRAEGDRCSQTFELRHCYWCGKGNCVNPAWPLWFCWNGGHPNG
jgi:hypothetical protein